MPRSRVSVLDLIDVGVGFCWSCSRLIFLWFLPSSSSISSSLPFSGFVGLAVVSSLFTSSPPGEGAEFVSGFTRVSSRCHWYSRAPLGPPLWVQFVLPVFLVDFAVSVSLDRSVLSFAF